MTESDTDGTALQQTTIQQTTGDGPEIGVELDVRTHYAHARYAMSETPGVIWYDPRDGLEKFALPDVKSDEDTGLDDRVLTSLTLYPHRKRHHLADPNDDWVLEYQYKTREIAEIGDNEYEHIVTYGGSDVYEDVYAAREAAAEKCEAYAEAEHRNAVAHRVEEVRG